MRKEKNKNSYLRKLTYTIVFGIFGFLFYLSTVIFKLEVFEFVVEMLRHVESYQADELFLGLMFLITGVFIDMILIKYRQNSLVKNQKDKLHIMKITLRTSQDIVNNFLNILSFHYLQAIKNNTLNEDTASTFDKLIQETTNKLKALSYLDHIPEKLLSSGLSVLDINEALDKQDGMNKKSNNH